MPRPDRRTGTRDMVFGDIVVVVYSYPSAVLACVWVVSGVGGVIGLVRTTGPLVADRPAAVASQPTMKAISWTKAFVSRAFAVLLRSWESLACKHGWVET